MAPALKFIAYLRVSTDKQGRSGLGLEAQREAVARHTKGGKLLGEYVETESGKRSDRPKLIEALARAKATGATLVIAKLDRLARNTRFLLTLIDSGANVAFADMPSVPAGATGRFILTQMAAVAELEAGLISERTKAALAAAKKRGVRLGNPNGAKHLRRYGNKLAVAALKAKAKEHATSLTDIVSEARAVAGDSLRAIAEELNRRSIQAPRGGQWHATSVSRLLARIEA
jgi:DNA invertase Pin-like site-specific DNA recombinase